MRDGAGKAIQHLDGVPHRVALHGVQHVLHPPVPLHGCPTGRKTGRVVLIARDAPKAELDALLGLLAVPDPEGGTGAGPGGRPAQTSV